jgi:hypothetical protein
MSYVLTFAGGAIVGAVAVLTGIFGWAALKLGSD